MLFAILLLLSTVPIFQATPPLTTQVIVDRMGSHNDNTAIMREREQQQFSILDMLQFTNGTCPAGCPLCDCIVLVGDDSNDNDNNNNSTTTEEAEDDEMECTLSKSIEACSSKSFQTCYADLIGLLPGGDADLEGLCNVECANNKQNEGQGQVSATCRICDIFACCNECPSDRASECFPSNIEDGYTPPGWEPADCSGVLGVKGNVFGGRSLSLVAMSLVVLGVFM